jgi:hypothetical protein
MIPDDLISSGQVCIVTITYNSTKQSQRMSGPATRTPIDQFALSLGSGLEPLGRGFSYFVALPMPADDLREYLHDPVGALPDGVCEAIGPVRIVLAPFLERLAGDSAPLMVSHAPPESNRLRSAYLLDKSATLFFAVKDENPSEYHQVFFNTIAHLLSRRVGKETQGKYATLLLAEMQQHVNGEVDEGSWSRKQTLPKTIDNQPPPKSKLFREYIAQSFADTMTLYMHGICCDIDVETGPRQLPSRWLRKRLEALYTWFPPPDGRPVLPEHLVKK